MMRRPLLELYTAAALCTAGACPGRGQAIFANVSANDTVHTLIGNPLLREWALLYREFHTEYLMCLYGQVMGSSVIVRYGVLGDVKPSHSLATAVIPVSGTPCVKTGDEIVGIAHSHPQTCRGGNGSACGLVEHDSNSMHPFDDPTADPCYESWVDIQTFTATGLELNVVVCGVGKFYAQRRNLTPNNPSDVCRYSAEDDTPVIQCGRDVVRSNDE